MTNTQEKQLSVESSSSLTEDDTFRILRRPSAIQVRGIFMELPSLERRRVLLNAETRDVFFKQHGWTLEEYQKATRHE